MTALPEGRQGQILALALLAVAIVAFNFAIVGPLFAFYGATAERVDDRLDVARRYNSAATDLPHLRNVAKQAATQSGEAALLLTGSSDAVAAASLESTLKDLVEQNGAKLASAQTLPPEPNGNFRRVGVRVAFSGNLTLLTGVLLGVEAAHPVLSVGNLDVRHGSAQDDDGSDTLTVAMDVYGFRSQ